MKWMFACVQVVENDFDCLLVSEDECISVRSVNSLISGKRAGCQCGIESRDFRSHIGHIVKEGTGNE